MLDYLLIAIAGLALFAQAVLGLLVTTRPPAQQSRLWYELTFITVGFIGMGAIMWGGIRTVQTSAQIEYGVTHIAQMGTENADTLKKQAEALTIQIELLDAQKALLETQTTQLATQGTQLNRLADAAVSNANRPTATPPTPPSPSALDPAVRAYLRQVQAGQAAAAERQKKLNEIRESSAKIQAWSDCNKRKNVVLDGLIKLTNDGYNYQNGWAYSRDGDLLRRQYDSWLGAAKQFLTEHQDMLNDTAEFSQVKEHDMGPILFVIPSGGANAWLNFNERRTALGNIVANFNKTACEAEISAAGLSRQ